MFIPSDVTFMDGYFVISEKGTARAQVCSLFDGFSWDALDFATAEGDPDNLVAIEKVNDQLWMFGEVSTELWHNVGGTAFPFQKVIGATIDRGCAAVGSVVRVDNSVYWLGDDLLVYLAEGRSPRRISTHAIERAISGYSKIDDAESYSYSENGHKFYVITFPSENVTWAYDVSTKMWARRSTYGVGRHT